MRFFIGVIASALAVAPSLAGAEPGDAPGVVIRGTVGVGGGFGLNDHVDDGGMMGGVELDAGLQIGPATIAVSFGTDVYGDTDADDAPISATTMAARIGVAPTLHRDVTPVRTFELFATAAAEIGSHSYDPSGSEFGFIIGPDVEYVGGSQRVGFYGARAGAGLAIVDVNKSGLGARFVFEVVGRRDRDTVELNYQRISCGGLFETGCDTTFGVARAGGSELGAMLSAALLFGR